MTCYLLMLYSGRSNQSQRERLHSTSEKNMSVHRSEWSVWFTTKTLQLVSGGHGCVSWSGLPSQSIMWDSYGFVIRCFKLTLLLQIIYLSKKPLPKKGPKMGILPPHPLNVGFKAANSSIQWRRRGRVPSWSCLWIRTLSSVICSQH